MPLGPEMGLFWGHMFNIGIYTYTGLPRSGKKFWKFFKVREKSGNNIFSQGNLKKMKKVREFQNFPKKMLVNRLLEILVSIICKQY